MSQDAHEQLASMRSGSVGAFSTPPHCATHPPSLRSTTLLLTTRAWCWRVRHYLNMLVATRIVWRTQYCLRNTLQTKTQSQEDTLKRNSSYIFIATRTKINLWRRRRRKWGKSIVFVSPATITPFANRIHCSTLPTKRYPLPRYRILSC